MRANPFESQLERLARTLTEQFGVQVVCQGDNAWTDGRQIVLPSLPEPLSENLERMMVGYLDHEMAHVAFSDFRVAERFSRKHPGFEGMLNVVEDALIERRAMQRWPGVRANLDALFAQIRDRILRLIAQRGPFDRFCTAVYLKLAHHNDLLGLDGELAGYEDLLDRFPQINNTREAGQLAERLLARWLSRQPQPKESPSTGRGESGGQKKGSPGDASQEGDSGTDAGADDRGGTDAEEDGDAADSPEGESAGDDGDADARQEGAAGDAESSSKPGAAESASGASDPCEDESDLTDDPASSDQAASPANEEPDADGEQADADDEKPLAGDSADGADHAQGAGATGLLRTSSPHSGTLISEALAEAISEGVAQLDSQRQYRPFTREYDRVDTVRMAADGEVQALLATGTDVVRRLRRGLANALRAAEKRWWRDDQVRGSLSPRTLYRLGTDRTQLDVFRVRSTVQGRSTAVSVVLDASGSMTASKMSVARQAVRVLLEALADLKIATEAFTFTTGDRFSLGEAHRASGQDPVRLQDHYSRFGNLEIGLIKQFTEPVKSALRRLPAVRGTGLTPLGEAMQIGAARLCPRPETRKIMLVLTDGRAGCECCDGVATTHAQYVAGLCRKAGIELVGVGILDDSLAAIVADTIVIHRLEDLPAQLCKLLGRTLQKGVCRVG